MEERLEYQLYCMQGDLERLKYDYEMEYRKIDWMNHRAKMYFSRMKMSGGVVLTALAIILVSFAGQSAGIMSIAGIIGEVFAAIVLLVDILLLLLVVLPWSFAFLKNFRMYLRGSNGQGNHLYSMITGKDYQKERREAEENVYVMSNKIIQMEFEIEQMMEQIDKSKEKCESEEKPLEENYEEEELQHKSSAEIRKHLYYLEDIEGNLQKQYDREYSITRQIENKNARPEHYIRKAVIMICCGLGGTLISSAIKVINLSTIHNHVIMYAAPILGMGCIFGLVLPSSFMIVKELIMRYVNSDKFIGKEYVDQVKNVSMSAEQMENEKALTEISQKLARIQAEKEELEELLQQK